MSQNNSKLGRSAKKKARKRLNDPQLKNNSIKQQNSSGPVAAMLGNPFSSLTDKQKIEDILEMRQNGEKMIVEVFESLNNILRQYDPITLIVILSYHGLGVGVNADGIQLNESSQWLQQAHIELIQALALQIPENELGDLLPTWDIVKKTGNKLIKISRAFQLSRMDEKLLAPSKIDRSINEIQELIRSHTERVRNWGFNSQLVTISKEIYSDFDQLIMSERGFSATNAIDVFGAIADLVKSKLSAKYKLLRELKSIDKPYDMLVKYYDSIEEGKEGIDKFLENTDIGEMSIDDLFSSLRFKDDLTMPDCFLVDSDELTKLLHIEKAIIDNVLSYFSYTFGELSNCKKEVFSLDNPIWKKPIISSSRGYYCPLFMSFFSFILDILDDIVGEIDKVALHKKRATYLESKIGEIVKTRFTESQVVPNLKWVKNKNQYENDLVIFIDSYVIIIEAKSHKISRPALRGGLGSIKTHIQEILIKPGKQSHRLEKRLTELRSQDMPDDPLLDKLPVDIHSIKKVIRVSVSLEGLGMLQMNLKLLNDAGWIPNDFAPCPLMNIADFEILFDFLDHPVQIIHYLLRKTAFEGSYNFSGDELDWMGLYITNSFNIANIFIDDATRIDASGMSEQLDKYYRSKDLGRLIDKPQPQTSSWFKEIFNKLAEKASPRWTEMGCALNYFSLGTQNNIIGEVKNLSKLVNRTWQVEGHENIIVHVPPESSEYALAVVLFKNENEDMRYKFIDFATEKGLAPEHAKYCLVIAINIDENDGLPYHFIELVEKRCQTVR